jgi:hypothetical protein
MQEKLQKYFSIYKHVTIPGIGSFYVETGSAQLDFINRAIHAPLHSIKYDNENHKTDEWFFSFLSKETDQSEPDSINEFNEFSQSLKEQLESSGAIQLQGIGTVAKNGDNYLFTPDNTVQNFFPDLVAERVIRQNAEHTVKVGEQHKTSTEMQEQLLRKVEVKKERWWIAAIILGAAGVAAIVYYYLAKG